MKFQKGTSGNPAGRPKGSRDKKSENIRKWLLNIIDSHRDIIAEDLAAVDPATRLQFIIKLLPYATPRLSPIETTADEGGRTVFILKEVDADVDAEPLIIKKHKTGATPASSEEEVMQREGLENIEQEPSGEEVTVYSRDDAKRVKVDIATQDEEQRARERLIYEQRKRMQRSGVIRQY